MGRVGHLAGPHSSDWLVVSSLGRGGSDQSNRPNLKAVLEPGQHHPIPGPLKVFVRRVPFTPGPPAVVAQGHHGPTTFRLGQAHDHVGHLSPDAGQVGGRVPGEGQHALRLDGEHHHALAAPFPGLGFRVEEHLVGPARTEVDPALRREKGPSTRLCRPGQPNQSHRSRHRDLAHDCAFERVCVHGSNLAFRAIINPLLRPVQTRYRARLACTACLGMQTGTFVWDIDNSPCLWYYSL